MFRYRSGAVVVAVVVIVVVGDVCFVHSRL